MLPQVHLIEAWQVGPCGLALGAQPEPGGGAEPADRITVPLVHTNWLDERQVCAPVQRSLEAKRAGGNVPVLGSEGCRSFHVGNCRRAPGQVCMFLEDPDAPIWRRAREWRFWREGLLYVGNRSEVEVAELMAEMGT